MLNKKFYVINTQLYKKILKSIAKIYSPENQCQSMLRKFFNIYSYFIEILEKYDRLHFTKIVERSLECPFLWLIALVLCQKILLTLKVTNRLYQKVSTPKVEYHME